MPAGQACACAREQRPSKRRRLLPWIHRGAFACRYCCWGHTLKRETGRQRRRERTGQCINVGMHAGRGKQPRARFSNASTKRTAAHAQGVLKPSRVMWGGGRAEGHGGGYSTSITSSSAAAISACNRLISAASSKDWAPAVLPGPLAASASMAWALLGPTSIDDCKAASVALA